MVAPPTPKAISWREVKQHNTPENAWLVINNKVYDLSDWRGHPGGNVLFTHAGEDATDAFAVFHPTSAYTELKQFYIGDLDPNAKSDDDTDDSDVTDVDLVRAYRKLRAQVKLMGLYDASMTYYAWKLISTFGIWLASVAVCAYGQSTAYYVVGAVVLGLFYQQSGWLAHDFLHHQVCPNHVTNDLLGAVVGDLWQGFSIQWWKNKHNTHHAVPNLHASDVKGETTTFLGDPDIDTMPLLAWSIEMARKGQDTAIGRFCIQHQAWLYFPLLLLARLSWLLQSFFYVFQKFSFGPYDDVQHPWAEKAGLLAHYGWNIAVPYFTGMSVLQGISYFLLSQMSCGLFLALVFSLGHNGMAVYEQENKPDFWQLQVNTTRNISSSFLVDWFTGGLNYQVDHHLFPMVPRHNLGKLNKLIKSLCKEYNVGYHETGFWRGLYEVVDHLADISHEFVTEFPAM